MKIESTKRRPRRFPWWSELIPLALLVGICCACIGVDGGVGGSSWKRKLPRLTVESADPADGEEGVPVDSDLTLFFSHAPSPDSVKRKITLMRNWSGETVKCTVTFVSAQVILTPVKPLNPGKQYRIEIRTRVKAGGTRPSNVGYKLRFTTAENLPLAVVTTSTERAGHTCTLLPSGLEFVAGGILHGRPTATTELREPDGGDLRPGPSFPEPLAHHTATLLPDGTVLIAGGLAGPEQRPTDGVLVYDPSAGAAMTPGRRLRQTRAFHVAELLAGGVLVFRGGGALPDEEYRLPALRSHDGFPD